MVYAQIKDGIIKNTIVINDLAILDLFSGGFDHLIRVDDLNIIPGINWNYDGERFSPPVYSEPEGEG